MGRGVGYHARDSGLHQPHALPEALEKWPVEWFHILIPRQLEIIFEINRRFLDDIRAHHPERPRTGSRVSLIDEGPTKHVRMANVAIVGSHSTNGVAAIHSELLRETTVKDLAEMFPERFNNKTNGVTPRRWLILANPWRRDGDRRLATVGSWILPVQSPSPLAEGHLVLAAGSKSPARVQAAIRGMGKRRTVANR